MLTNKIKISFHKIKYKRSLLRIDEKMIRSYTVHEKVVPLKINLFTILYTLFVLGI